MVLNPEIQRCAQEELDRIVGYDRLPNFGDRPNLPYVEAILKESIRYVRRMACIFENTLTYRILSSIVGSQWAPLVYLIC